VKDAAAISCTGSAHYCIERRTGTSLWGSVAACVLIITLVALPAFSGRDFIQDLIFVFYMSALAQCWNLLAGYTGLVSVGQQAFVGLGGYLLFALTILAGLDPLAAIVLAGALSAAFAVPTALIVFRLRGAYFAIGTWVMAEVYRLVLAQFKQLGGGTGKSLPPSVTNEVFGIEWIKSLFAVRTPAARDIISYWVALVLAVGTIALVYLVLRSRRGLALGAIRDSEAAAESVGVDSFRIKFGIYVIIAAATGMIGALIYLQKARISPDAAFSVLDWTAYVIFIVVIGGIGTIEGPILGTTVFYLMQRYLASYGAWYLILLGCLAISVMLLAPRGLWGFITERYGLVLFPIRLRLVVERGDQTYVTPAPKAQITSVYALFTAAARQATTGYLPALHRGGSAINRLSTAINRQVTAARVSRRALATYKFFTAVHQRAMKTYLPTLHRRGLAVYGFVTAVHRQAMTIYLSTLRRGNVAIGRFWMAAHARALTAYLPTLRRGGLATYRFFTLVRRQAMMSYFAALRLFNSLFVVAARKATALPSEILSARRRRGSTVSFNPGNQNPPMSKQMQGKICVITGGAGSIGLAAAKLLLAEGAKVMLLDLSEAALKKAAADIAGDSLAWSAADVTKSDQVKNCIASTVSRWGKIDVLFSNASNFGVVAPITEYPEDVFDSVFAVHVKSAFLAAKHTLPFMNDGGSIIMTSSIVAVEGDPGVCAYITAKHAQVGLMRALAKEAAARNIRVNTIHPGPVDDAFQFEVETNLSRVLGRDAGAVFNEAIPLRRHVRAEEVARSVLYLASDASRFTTGSLLMVDGGLSA
jgi:branched-chain amino acid transport system permease protein